MRQVAGFRVDDSDNLDVLLQLALHRWDQGLDEEAANFLEKAKRIRWDDQQIWQVVSKI